MIGAFESRAILPSELDPARLNASPGIPGTGTQARARKILAAETSASRDRGQVIASYRPAIPLAGDRLAEAPGVPKICATCHQAEGRGSMSGPTWRRSQTDLPRTYSSIFSTRTERSRLIS